MSSSTELDEAIKRTKKTLRPIFSKPKCSSKLLAKPPFRFIHDIITAIIEATQFPKKYFTAHELDSRNFTFSKDKQPKIELLDKLIYLVGVCHGSPLDVRASKIIAGLEPVCTNTLLTHFGKLAVDDQLDRHGVIEFCKDGGQIGDFIPTKKDDAEQINEMDVSERQDNTSQKTNGFQSSHDGVHDNENKTSQESRQDHSHHMLLQKKINDCNNDPDTTRTVIGNIITKPKCSEKLLAKPPFRFLHDLIMAVNHANHMNLSEILSVDEIASSKTKDKQAKVQFLNKVISHVEKILNITVDVKPSKIVAGLEPENTCQFIQLFALASTVKDDDNVDMITSETVNAKEDGKSIQIHLRKQDSPMHENKTSHEYEKMSNESVSAGDDDAIQQYKDKRDTENYDIHHVQEKTIHTESPPSFGDKKLVYTDSNTDSQMRSNAFEAIKVEEKEAFSKPTILPNNKNSVTEACMKQDYERESIADLLPTSSDNKGFHLTDRIDRNNPRLDEGAKSVSRLVPPKLNTCYAPKSPHPFAIRKPENRIQFLVFDDDRDKLNSSHESKSNDRVGNKSGNKSLDGRFIIEDQSQREYNNRINLPSGSSGLRLRLHKKKGRENTLQNPIASEIDTKLLAKSIKSILGSAVLLGRLMNHFPTDMLKIAKDREMCRSEYFLQMREFKEAKNHVSLELEPIKRQIIKLDDDIEQMKLLIESAKSRINSNDRWIGHHLESLGF